MDATTDYFVEKYSDIENFEKGKGILQIKKINNPVVSENTNGAESSNPRLLEQADDSGLLLALDPTSDGDDQQGQGLDRRAHD